MLAFSRMNVARHLGENKGKWRRIVEGVLAWDHDLSSRAFRPVLGLSHPSPARSLSQIVIPSGVILCNMWSDIWKEIFGWQKCFRWLPRLVSKQTRLQFCSDLPSVNCEVRINIFRILLHRHVSIYRVVVLYIVNK